jgi:stalled ribosome rescue protein Dom34
METKKHLGIWMDHLNAHLIDLNSKKNNHSITSKFTFDTKDKALRKNENLMHNKEQQMNELFYKEIAAEILKYDNVVLFGPTNAKQELHNLLNKDLHFKDIKIDIEPADKMTDNEKYAFVENHFKS